MKQIQLLCCRDFFGACLTSFVHLPYVNFCVLDFIVYFSIE